MHYLGREYMYNGEWEKSIEVLKKHLELKSSTWDEERGASMRFISRGYINLGKYDEAIEWLNNAINETSNVREPYVEMGVLMYKMGKFNEGIDYLEKALKIDNKSPFYINEDFAWDETIYDILGLCYYEVGNLDEALKNVKLAIQINGNNDRLKNNYFLINEEKKKM